MMSFKLECENRWWIMRMNLRIDGELWVNNQLLLQFM